MCMHASTHTSIKICCVWLPPPPQTALSWLQCPRWKNPVDVVLICTKSGAFSIWYSWGFKAGAIFQSYLIPATVTDALAAYSCTVSIRPVLSCPHGLNQILVHRSSQTLFMWKPDRERRYCWTWSPNQSIEQDLLTAYTNTQTPFGKQYLIIFLTINFICTMHGFVYSGSTAVTRSERGGEGTGNFILILLSLPKAPGRLKAPSENGIQWAGKVLAPGFYWCGAIFRLSASCVALGACGSLFGRPVPAPHQYRPAPSEGGRCKTGSRNDRYLSGRI